MSSNGEQIVVGRITTAHGIKGWVKLYSYTDPPEGILSYQPWLISRGRQQQTIEIAEGRWQGKYLVALPKGNTDRNQAEALAGWEIRIDKSLLPDLEAGEFYWYQLEGLVVQTVGGARLGIIAELLETGANDVLVVRADAESIDDEERLIPFVEEEVVTHVDMERGVVTVDWETDY